MRDSPGVERTLAYQPAGMPDRIAALTALGTEGDECRERHAFEYFMRAHLTAASRGLYRQPRQITELWISERGRPASHRFWSGRSGLHGPSGLRTAKRIATSSIRRPGEGSISRPSMGALPSAHRLANSPSRSSGPSHGRLTARHLLTSGRWHEGDLARLRHPEGRLAVAPQPLFHDNVDRDGNHLADNRMIAYVSRRWGTRYLCLSVEGRHFGRSLLVSVGSVSAPTWDVKEAGLL